MDVGLLIVRVVLGLVIAAHGTQKLFGWFGGPGMKGSRGFVASLGFSPAALWAPALALAETGGGLLLVTGFVTPLGAAAVTGAMLAAIVAVHRPNGFWNSAGGYEFNLLIASVATALAFTGPGAYSIDAALGWTLQGTGWGLGALGLAVLGALVSLATRRSAVAVVQQASQKAA